MTKPALIIVLMFVLALGAGVVAGKLSTRVLPSVAVPVERPVGSLSDLNLTGDQRAQMKRIWEDVRDTAHDCEREKENIRRTHEANVVALLSEAQREKYQNMTNEANAAGRKIDARRQTAFDDAVAKTMGILNEQQRLAYRQILQERVGETPTHAENEASAGGSKGNSASQPAP
jgi:Spy/CpxP family protein refolding chaperone